MGRWLAGEHPEITEPSQWTRQTCAAWVAAVDRMAVGDYSQSLNGKRGRAGDPLSPKTKSSYLRMARAFFRDLQEWEWIPRRFDPARALSTPRSLRALIGPDPRVIADDIWAKLLWAGLNLEAADLPRADGRVHPVEMIRAITLTWLFSGQRSDEIARLRVGCVRWQHDGVPISGDCDQVLARDAVCLLDVPVHKTGTAFTKPVDPLLGQAIEAWQAVRPDQPKMLDPKTGERAEFLFAIRAKRVAKHYINEKIIPMLCRKAGVPASDVRGKITSHRARSTIASQLYNAKEPMTLFELQAWLGHASPETTQHYAKITPNTLTRAYRDAGYFERNVRTIEVLLDRDAVTAGPGRRRRAMAVLRPRPRAVLLHLLRAVPAPDGLRQVRLLHPEGLLQGPTPGGQGQPAADARRRSRSPTTSAPPSTTARPPWTSSSNVSPTCRHQPGPRPGNSPSRPRQQDSRLLTSRDQAPGLDKRPLIPHNDRAGRPQTPLSHRDQPRPNRARTETLE